MERTFLGIVFFIGIFEFAIGDSFYNYCQAPGLTPSQNTAGLQLQFLQILTRHGDRTPTVVSPIEPIWNCTLNTLNLPSDIFSNTEEQPKRLYRKNYLPGREELPGNCMLGQLTELGLSQHMLLGSQYRQLYVDEYKFLPEVFDDESIYIRSTDVPRTLQSVMGNLYAMYPPQYRKDGKIDILDLHTMDIWTDDMTPNLGLCPRLTQLYTELVNSTAWKQNDAQYASVKALFDKVYNNSLPYLIWGGLFDNLGARVCHNKDLPPGITDGDVQEVYNAVIWEFNYIWNNSESGILGSGTLLQTLYTRIQENIAGQKLPLMYFYSGHDSTVGPLMATLGYFKGWPPYASHIEMELWSDSNQNYFVQVKYNGMVISLPGCSDVMCEYSQFQNLMTERIPQNFKKQCNQMN